MRSDHGVFGRQLRCGSPLGSGGRHPRVWPHGTVNDASLCGRTVFFICIDPVLLPPRYSHRDDFDQNSGMNGTPSDYERRAREQIHEWKNPTQGWFGETMRQIGWPVDRLGTLLKNAVDVVGLPEVINKALAGILGILTDAAAWTVSPEAICEKFRKVGHDVRQLADIFALDLEQVDRTVGWLGLQVQGRSVHGGCGCRRRRRSRTDSRHPRSRNPEPPRNRRVRHVLRIRRCVSTRTLVRDARAGSGVKPE